MPHQKYNPIEKCTECGKAMSVSYAKPYDATRIVVYYTCDNGHTFGKVREATDAELKKFPAFLPDMRETPQSESWEKEFDKFHATHIEMHCLECETKLKSFIKSLLEKDRSRKI